MLHVRLSHFSLLLACRFHETRYNVFIALAAPPLGRPPYREEMVACQYRKDGNFYRAVIFGESRTTPNEYSAFFVDFGNTESVPLSDMKALPHDLKKVCNAMSLCYLINITCKNIFLFFFEFLVTLHGCESWSEGCQTGASH